MTSAAADVPVSDPSLADAGTVAASLGVDPAQGLSSAESARRRAAHGANELRASPPVPAWRRLLAQLLDPLVALLAAAIAVSLAAWAIEGARGWPVDALVIALIVVLNAVLGFVQEARAGSAVAALSRATAATSGVLRDGAVQRVPSSELVPGDILLLSEGDAVGADARLLRAAALRVQEASLTGESEAVNKDPATLAQPAALAERTNMVFKSTVVTQGSGRAVVTATGMATQVGSIATMLEATVEPPTPLQVEIARVGRMLGIAVVVIASVVVATVLALTDVRGVGGVVEVLLLGVSLAVAAVPEGLPAILSLVLALGVERMARRNAVVKKLSSVESLGAASAICSDKTGTLTRSEMTIQRIVTAAGTARVTGVGYAPVGRFEQENGQPPHAAMRAEHLVVLGGGSLAGNATLRETSPGVWEIQGDPTEAAFLVAERKLGSHGRRARRFERVRELPFTSERKMMSSIEIDHEHGDARVLVCKGAPDVLLARCARLREGAAVRPLDETTRARILADVDRLSDEAMRPLAVAYRPLSAGEDEDAGALERDLIFVGTVGIIDPPREEAAAAIAEAQRAGIRVIMITGDHPRTAARIAADLGLAAPGARALSGSELDAMDARALAVAVREHSVFARVAPAHKLRIVAALEARGHVVAMTGDGVNDAPALKAADIGVAMGITGTEVSKEAAVMILTDDNFATIVSAVAYGRSLYDNLVKYLRFQMSTLVAYIAIFIGAGIFAVAGGVPLNPLQILWLNMVIDIPIAIALGFDQPTRGLMDRAPRPVSAPVLSRANWVRLCVQGLVMTGGALAAYQIGDHQDGAVVASTMLLTTLSLFHLAAGLLSRDQVGTIFDRDAVPGATQLRRYAVALLAIVAVTTIDLLGRIFDTVELSGDQWGICLALAGSLVVVEELIKLVLRRARGGIGDVAPAVR